jgi:hypothetical protein
MAASTTVTICFLATSLFWLPNCERASAVFAVGVSLPKLERQCKRQAQQAEHRYCGECC